jgi:hypothetical protein
MLFGAQSFSSAPFSSEFVGNVTILATGERINISIGSIEVDIVIRVIGNQINLATNTSRCDKLEPNNSRSNWCLDSNRSR